MRRYSGPNTHLINNKHADELLSTPALMLDFELVEENIQTMMEHCQQTGQKLRPHAKSHKCSALAKRQMEAGAIGLCCATLREAEVMVANNIKGILITSPIAGTAKAIRLIKLNDKTDDLMAVVDDPLTVAMLAKHQKQINPLKNLKLLVDLDIGLHRTGVSNVAAARTLAGLIAKTDNLTFLGVQAYAGHIQHIANYSERLDASEIQAQQLESLVTALRSDGLPPKIVTGGGTGTHDIDHRFGAFNELQAGSYLFMDAQYNVVALNEEGTNPFHSSLTVLGTVVSSIHDSHSVIDAGLKSFATDGPLPELTQGAPLGSIFRFMGDEHGAIVYPKGSNERLDVGNLVSCIVPHCDPTVNLYDNYHCMRGNTLFEIMPIDARGNS